MRQVVLGLALVGCNGVVGSGDGVVDVAPEPGWTAELVGSAHDVDGFVTYVDEDTIEISGFTYDGGGINARIFLAVDGAVFERNRDYELTENLVGTGPYEGDTLTLEIPEVVAPGTWDALTLWCIPANVSFGDAIFEPPE